MIETSAEFLETLKHNVLTDCKDEVFNKVDSKDAVESLQELLKLDQYIEEQNYVKEQVEESFKKYIKIIKEIH